MATKTMTPAKGVLNKLTAFSFEAADTAADGMEFTLPRMSDEYVVVLVQNTAATAYDITVKAPAKGSYAAATADETLELSAGEFAILRFESARWAGTDGTVKLVPENVAVKVAVLC